MIQRYLHAAMQNPVHYKTPAIVFRFTSFSSIDAEIEQMIKSSGVMVEYGLSASQPQP